MIDWNATRAAAAAGYSETAARQIGSENLSKPYIKSYIDKIKNNISELSGVTALRNVLELKKIAYSSLAKFKDDWMTEKEFSDLTDDEKSCLSEIVHTTKTFENSTEKIVKFKLYDKIKAIEVINKMLGLNEAEKFDHTTKGKELTTPKVYVSDPETKKEIDKLFDHEDD